MVAARLNGFLPQGFTVEARLSGPVGRPSPAMATNLVEIGDARALQADAASEAAFFAEHGFVLLPHETRVGDWDRDVAEIYLAEVEAVIRERLLPGKRIEVQQTPNVLRRGRDTQVPFYAEGVHSDGGIGAEDYAHNIGAFAGPEAAQWWRSVHYAREEVAGVIWMDFWRTTNMAGPLEHMPLALCDISTLDADDLCPTGLTGIAPEGRETHHLSLRFNPRQHWYHYPRMTDDELLVFKLAEFWKDKGHAGNCFHSAFAHVDAPADAQLRQSCEHRVGVTVLRD